MTAETLRQAAALMRERAEAATPGPWESGADGWVETVSGDGEDWCFVRQVGTSSDLTAQMLHGQEAADAQTEANAEHIASWHPAVALAVADWLDAVASGDDSGSDLEWSHPRDVFAAAAVARAYLGADA